MVNREGIHGSIYPLGPWMVNREGIHGSIYPFEPWTEDRKGIYFCKKLFTPFMVLDPASDIVLYLPFS
ncbi:hypothetical protein A9Q98_02355 [Thalassotalea sp. 42_200_T64]|nr:hypothetical protein A9Q98_02355 [Thalassotalea sp. 42_200_T64]